MARDPTTGEVVPGGFETETRQVLSSLEAILEAAGTSLRNVLKATCYLRNMGDFAAFNKVWKAYFPVNPPARTCIQAGRLGRGFGVEMDLANREVLFFAISRVITRAKANGKWVALNAMDVAGARRCLERGADIVLIGTAGWLVRTGRNFLTEAQQALACGI